MTKSQSYKIEREQIMRSLVCSICLFVFTNQLSAIDFGFSDQRLNPDSTFLTEENFNGYSIADSILEKIPFRNQNNLNRIYPGVVSYFQDFYIRGGASYETGFFIDGSKFNDLFTGKNSFIINPNVFEKIDYYNGFIPNDFGNVSSGLFNYTLRTCGNKISFEVEHLNDNIIFTNDAFSGKKRLGAYYYGHNETNISVGGPLYFSNVRFFTNVNYLFQRDKNPQRYPGADNLKFDNSLEPGLLPDSIFIDLPAGIVPFNSFENINFLSTLLFDFENVIIKASGIYFDENGFTERNHILQYLNPRAGLVDKNGGIFNIKIDHKVNETFSYSLNGNYSFKDEITTDQYLGDEYWSYGDSVANANAGVIWQRSNLDINYGHMGRYTLPTKKYIMISRFKPTGYPIIDHQKSYQKSITLSGYVNCKLENHNIRIGGDYTQNTIGLWQLPGQAILASDYYRTSLLPPFNNATEIEIKEFVLVNRGVNNIGYDLLGKKNESAPQPVNYSFYLDDYFDAFNNFQFYVGLRYDYFDFDFKKMIDPAAPEKTINFMTGELISSGLLDTESSSFISPKLALKFQAIKNLAFTASYSQNVQSHPYSNLYTSFYQIGNILRGGNSIAPAIKELKPIVNKSVELGIEYSTLSNFNVKMNLFNKNTTSILQPEIQKTNQGSPYQSYNFLSDSGIINLNGIEFIFNYFYKGFYLGSTLNYQSMKPSVKFYRATYSFASFPHSDINSTRTNKFSLNVLTSYDFSYLAGILNFFNGINISAIFNFNTGHPYIKYINFTIPNSGYIEETTPNVSQIDLQIEKRFELYNGLKLDLYFYIINLLDTKNIYEVFSTTGKADDDGFSTMYYSQNYSEERWAQIIQLHQLLVDYNPGGGQQTFYGPPRQIGFGIKLNY